MRAATILVLMPEAAVEEDGAFTTRENEIWFSWKVVYVGLKLEFGTNKEHRQMRFRIGILGFIRPHRSPHSRLHSEPWRVDYQMSGNAFATAQKIGGGTAFPTTRYFIRSPAESGKCMSRLNP